MSLNTRRRFAWVWLAMVPLACSSAALAWYAPSALAARAADEDEGSTEDEGPAEGESPAEDEGPAEPQPIPTGEDEPPAAPADEEEPPADDSMPEEGAEDPAVQPEEAADDGLTPVKKMPAEQAEDEEPAAKAEPADGEPAEHAPPRPRRVNEPDDAVPPLAVGDAKKDSSEIAVLDAASLNGVHPGHTTHDELHSLWGKPQRVEKIAGGVRETFEVPQFGRVVATVGEELVESLTIRLPKPVIVDTVARRLRVDDVEPIEVLDEHGQPLGQAYPERGVLFGFAPHTNPPHVFQIVLEPIQLEPFLARAEKRLPTRYNACLNDVENALRLDPENSRAHWLHAEVMLRSGELDLALHAIKKAVKADPSDLEYRLTLGAIMSKTGDIDGAIEQVKAVAVSGRAQNISVARAYCQWGDLVAAGHHDYQQAIKLHLKAIKLAEPFASGQKSSQRRAGNEVLVDANLAIANDVGWGRWQGKSRVVPKWIEKAALAAEIAARDPESDARLRVLEGAMAALSGVSDPPDASAWQKRLVATGQKLVDGASDPSYKAHLAWRVGVALANATEVEAARKRATQALALGKSALEFLEEGESAGKQLAAHDLVRGRLCYRLGAVMAILQSDHKQAVGWFDRAVPLLERPAPAVSRDNGRHGETFVSMAVSYWEVNNREEALRLTNQGVKLMEQARDDGRLSNAALAIPYANLSNMHQLLGNAAEAKKFSELAAKYEDTVTE